MSNFNLFIGFLVVGASMAYPKTSNEESRFTREASSGPGGNAGFEGAIAFDGPANIARMVEEGLGNTFKQIQALASRSGGGDFGGGGHSFSGSFSTSGNDGGEGAVLHSRFSEDGTGFEKEFVSGGPNNVHASSSAQGPNNAFSSSFSSIDSNGQKHYSVNAKKN